MDGGLDPDWTLFARLALAGARIVSLPEPLSSHRGCPGRVDDVPGDGLAVLEAFEQRSGVNLSDLPQFAATLAASLARLSAPSDSGRNRCGNRRSMPSADRSGMTCTWASDWD